MLDDFSLITILELKGSTRSSNDRPRIRHKGSQASSLEDSGPSQSLDHDNIITNTNSKHSGVPLQPEELWPNGTACHCINSFTVTVLKYAPEILDQCSDIHDG